MLRQILNTFNTSAVLTLSKCCQSTGSTFKYSDLITNTCSTKKAKPTGALGFGNYFTDHMFAVKWKKESGWSKPQIQEFGDIQVHPGAKFMHYAVGAFEGMKAMKGKDGVLRMFRPDRHVKRFLESIQNLVLPTFDSKEFIECLKALLRLDRDWAPSEFGTAVYIRPFIIGDDPALGVDICSHASLYILLSPVGSYYTPKAKGVSLYADPKYVRAWPGGCGASKMSSNYGPTLRVQQIGRNEGCEANLWLFGPDELLTEVGTMNVFVYWTNEHGKKELCTPNLNGLILPGVTRDSLLELAKNWPDILVSERDISMKQLLKALEERRIHGMFGSGTACVVSPIGELVYKGRRYEIPNDTSDSSITKRCHKALTDIQYAVKAPHPWMVSIDE